jgi:excisionase family DNA binding protein
MKLLFDELARDPARCAALNPAERAQVQLQCLAILAALAQTPVVENAEALHEPGEAAVRLHVSRSTIYEMLRDGRLSYIEKGERGKLIPESALREFIERQTKRAARPTIEAVRARVRLRTHGQHP